MRQESLLDDGIQEFLARVEPVMDHRRGHLARLGDLRHGRVGDAALRKEPKCCVEQARTSIRIGSVRPPAKVRGARRTGFVSHGHCALQRFWNETRDEASNVYAHSHPGMRFQVVYYREVIGEIS